MKSKLITITITSVGLMLVSLAGSASESFASPIIPVGIYAGSSNPGVVYHYVGDTNWEPISPTGELPPEDVISESINIESPHPYPNNYDNTWIETRPDAAAIRVHFTYIRTESDYDHLYVKDSEDSIVNDYSGNYADEWSSWVFGDTIKIQLVSDYSVVDDGFVVDKLEWSTTQPEIPLGYAVSSLVDYEGQFYAAVITNPNVYYSSGKVYRYEGDKNWKPIDIEDEVNQITFLIVYNGELYAGTAAPARLYKYDPENELFYKVLDYSPWYGFRSAYSWGDWLYLGEWYYDRFARWKEDGTFEEFQPQEYGSCIYSFEEYQGNLYAGAYEGEIYKVTYEPPAATSIWGGPDDYYAWTLKEFKGELYMGFDRGYLYKYDGENFVPLSWSYTPATNNPHEGIISMATDGEYLYIGAGGGAVGYPEYMPGAGTGKVYRTSDGVNFELTSGILGTGIQVLHIPKKRILPTYNVAVILAEPSDKSFDSSHNKAYFEGIVEQVRDYYCENAFGKWDPDTKTCNDGLFNLNFDVYDNGGLRYKLPGTLDYYGKDFEDMPILPPDVQFIDGRYILTVGQDGNGKIIEVADKDRTEKFIWDAINEADENIDYNNYQSVIIIYAGSSYQQTEQKDYLTTQWWTPLFSPAPVNSPDEFINNWISVAENETKYAWSHELGHALGNILTGHRLCDLYPSAFGFCDYGGSVIDYFDVMGTPTLWGQIKDIVSYFSSFSKVKLGWIQEKIVEYGSHIIESLETMKFGDEVARYDLPNGSYYLLEARTNDSQYSKWDTDLPNNPLVIYRVSPKEITVNNQTKTLDFVNIAGTVGAVVPNDPRIPPIPDPLDLPFKNPENNVLIGINNRIAEPDSFKINAQISEYSVSNYIGAVLRPKLSLLEKIWQFASDPFKTELSEEKEIITTPFGPGRRYLHVFGYKIEQVYECAGDGCIGRYSMMQGIFWYGSGLFILLLLLLRFCLKKIVQRIKGEKTINILQKARKIILWIIIGLAVIFALSFFISFSADIEAATLDNLSIPYGVIYKSVAADLDLHAYDEQGRHTGMNYETGEYENQIPGAEASGDLIYDDEWIFVPEGVNVRFLVSSQDVQEMFETYPELQELTDGIETYEAQAIYYDPESQRYESNVVTEQIKPGIRLEHRITGTYDVAIESGILLARVDFDPNTLNLKSKGKWVTAYIELPVGYDINEIDLESIRLNNQIPIEPRPTRIGDYDHNGIPDLMVKFNRSAVQDILEVGDEVEIIITGEMIDGSPFVGSDIISVISQGK